MHGAGVGAPVGDEAAEQDSPDFKENKLGLKHEADVLKTLEHP
jgi:hypothetical protein